MGKIVKICSSCDEGFAEKFAFCPNCGQTLQTFEMNPVIPETPAAKAEAFVAQPEPEEVVKAEATPAIEAAPEKVDEIPAYMTEEFAASPADPVDEPVIEEEIKAEPVVETKAPKKARKAAAAAVPVVQTAAMNADARRTDEGWVKVSSQDAGDDAFRVTVIEEKNVGTRRILLAGSFGLMLFMLMSAMVYNLFSKDLEVGSINDEMFLAMLSEDVPTEIEEEVVKKNKDDGGGGGGGGREEKEETTQGDLADQSPKPTRPPDAKVFRSDNFELKMPPPQTEGNRTFEKKFDRWGDPNGRFASFSNGTGSGGGQGSGVGTGQGSGRGTGAGSGTGSGSGGGLGSGNGNGTGAGDGDSDGPPPPRVAGVTQGLKIISKPRPGYTDSARTANIQGTVILRVTFLASGAIGSVSVVKGLPNGLSEQAIAAAKRINFEPAKVNGAGQTVTKQIEYSFSIY